MIFDAFIGFAVAALYFLGSIRQSELERRVDRIESALKQKGDL